MLPHFNESGYLPAGIHLADLAEIEIRFGTESEIRRVQMESLRWLVALAQRTGVERIIINGSFVTDVLEPNDVDCVLLINPNSRGDELAIEELLTGLPFIQLQLVEEPVFRVFVTQIFATDRKLKPKGVVEVIR